MPNRQSAPLGAPCWIDLATSDTAKSRNFYCELFGWTAGEPSEEFGGYFMFLREGVPIAGAMAAQPGSPDAWSIYLATDDMYKTLEAATSHGGTVVVDAMPVADLGTMAYVTDAGGAMIGLWQPDTFPGFTVIGEHATPSWFELNTREYERSVAFYRDVFRWETQVEADSPEFRYTTQVEGGAQYAGIMDATAFLPEGVPAHWSVYFGVDDTDAALAKAVELGATVVQPAMETPYGRLAAALDTNGAQFKLVAPNESMPAR